MSSTRNILLLVILLSTTVANAQEKLTLDKAIDAALKNNREITISTLDEEASRARFRQTRAVFLPQVKVSYTAMSTDNPLNAFGFKLQQQSIAQSDFNPDLLNSPSATNNFMAKIEALQPIINMDALALRQASGEWLNAMTYKSQRTKQHITLEVEKAYAQLQLAQLSRHVIEESFATAKKILATTEHRSALGYLQKSDLLLAEVQVASVETARAEAESNVHTASEYIALLMGTPAPTLYEVDSITLYDGVEDVSTDVPENRADLMALQSQLNAQDKLLASGRASYLPRLNAFGEYLINDDSPLGFGSPSYLAGVQLSWTIFNGLAMRNKVTEQRLERQKVAEQLSIMKEQTQLEARKTARHLNDIKSMIVREEVAVQQAAEALRILQNRYQQGLVSTNEVLQAQSTLSQHRLGHAHAIFEFNITYAYLRFLTQHN
jgi:outer membrane protein TolC